MYDEPEKLNDNDALNRLLEEVQSLNKKVGLFYWLAILSIIASLAALIAPHVSWA